MKKLLYLVLFVLVVISLTGCEHEHASVIDTSIPAAFTETRLNEESVEITVSETTSVADDSGNISADNRQNLPQYLLKKTTYLRDSLVNKWINYEYNSKNELIKTTEYDSDGSIRMCYEYYYDTFGNIIETKTYYQGSLLEGNRVEYIYDDNGKELSYIVYKKDGVTVNRRCDTSYSNGNLSRRTEYDSMGNTLSYIEFEYDSSNILLKKKVYKNDNLNNPRRGNIYLHSWDEYNYNSLGLCIACSTYSRDSQLAWKVTYEYDENGCLTKETTQYLDGSIGSIIEYEYFTIQ